ncbi:hypothetical protein H0H92_011268, partial [Tricholoma furcatifolium]
DSWVKRNNFKRKDRDGLGPEVAILDQTPLSCMRAYVQFDNGHGECPAVFIASNESKEELERAQDFAVIKRVADILQTNDPPVWRRPVDI